MRAVGVQPVRDEPGLNNVIRAALQSNVERVIFTSNDKAVNPTNVMGASKMMGERLVMTIASLSTEVGCPRTFAAR